MEYSCTDWVGVDWKSGGGKTSALSAFHGSFCGRCDITIPHLPRFRVPEAENALDTNRRCFSILFTYLCVSNIRNKTISYTESF